MNWYRFKIELFAWVFKTATSAITTAALGRILFQPVDGTRSYSLAMRHAAEHEWVFPAILVSGVVILWVSYWRIFGILRSRKAYGK